MKRDWLSFDDAWGVLSIVRDGSDGWHLAICPSHIDDRASLSIKEGDEGELVVHCFAGCNKMEIIKEIKEMLNGEEDNS